MPDSLRFHLTNVLEQLDEDSYLSIEMIGPEGCICDTAVLADALLADPTIKAIIDLAAYAGAPRDDPWKPAHRGPTSPEVRALLADWRAER